MKSLTRTEWWAVFDALSEYVDNQSEYIEAGDDVPPEEAVRLVAATMVLARMEKQLAELAAEKPSSN